MVMFEDYHIPVCPLYTCVTHYNSNQGHLLTQCVLSRHHTALGEQCTRGLSLFLLTKKVNELKWHSTQPSSK